MDHDGCRAIGTNAFDKLQCQIWIAIQVNNDNVNARLYQFRQNTQAVGIGSELLDLATLTSSESSGCFVSALLVRADHSYGQVAIADEVGNLTRRRHNAIASIGD